MQPMFTTSTSFVSGSNIFNVTLSSIEPPRTSFALWHAYHQHSGIKNSTPTNCNLCKYIWEVILCMILIGKECLEPEIWIEIPDQAEGIEDMMRIVWGKEAHY